MNFSTILFILTFFLSQGNTITAFSLKKVYSSVIPHKIHTEILYEEFSINQGILNLKNQRGNVHIKTGWQTNKIFIKAIKKSSDLHNFPEILYSQKSNSQTISIESKINAGFNQSIDFELIVPHTIALNITCQEGSINVNKVKNPIVLTTGTGDITISTAYDTIKAVCTVAGSITINHTKASINAHTNSGNIAIHEADSSLSISTNHGSITIESSKMHPEASIKASTDYGSINLFLPADLNATLFAKTLNGTLTSDFSILIKPFTTQLNKQAWKKFKMEVEGTIGNGSILIKAESKNGNIQIHKKDIF